MAKRKQLEEVVLNRKVGLRYQSAVERLADAHFAGTKYGRKEEDEWNANFAYFLTSRADELQAELRKITENHLTEMYLAGAFTPTQLLDHGNDLFCGERGKQREGHLLVSNGMRLYNEMRVYTMAGFLE